MTDEKTLDELERMVRDAEHGVHSFIIYQLTLLDLIADSRNLADAMTFVPRPEKMSGYDHQDAPDEAKAMIALASKLHGIDQPAGGQS